MHWRRLRRPLCGPATWSVVAARPFCTDCRRCVPDVPELTDPQPDGLGRRERAHLYGARIDARSVGRWNGVAVTTVERTLVELARHDPRDGIMAADAALREAQTTMPAIERELRDARGWPGVRRARDVLVCASPLAESPLESLTRWGLRREGLRPLVPQLQVGGYRVDLAVPERRLLTECDGRLKYDAGALWKEKRREQDLRACGWRVQRVIWLDVLARWPVTSRRLWAALTVG